MDITFIGDVHGKFKRYLDIVSKLRNESIQLGDLGIGFLHQKHNSYVTYPHESYPRLTNCYIPNGHYFIRGNHDNPERCKSHKSYLGDYGIYKDKIMYISGALSLDKCVRTTYIDWWPDEELSYTELNNAINLYSDNKLDIVISHDCPHEYNQYLYGANNIKNITSTAFDIMLDIHRPKYWIFGHHHKSLKQTINNTTYICLSELEYLTLSI